MVSRSIDGGRLYDKEGIRCIRTRKIFTNRDER